MPIIAKFFPNGEFSYGWYSPPRSIKKLAPIPESREPAVSIEEYLQFLDRNSLSVGDNSNSATCFLEKATGNKIEIVSILGEEKRLLLRVTSCITQHVTLVSYSGSVAELTVLHDLAPLVHLVSESSGNAPEGAVSRKHLEKMTPQMGRNIRQGAFVLEHDYHKDNLALLTLTIPSVDERQAITIAENWGKMINNFMDSLKYHFDKMGKVFSYVYCTEIQGKRLDRTGILAPHLHILFRARDNRRCAWYVSAALCRKLWQASISRVGLFFPREAYSACENLRKIRKSAGGYLSKYLTKSLVGRAFDDSSLSPEAKEAISKLKTQWGGMARSLCRRVKALTTRISSDGGNGWIADSLPAYFRDVPISLSVSYFRTIQILISTANGVGFFLFGGVGRLSTPTLMGGLSSLIEDISSFRERGDYLM